MGKSRREIRALSDALDLENIDQDVLWSFLTRKDLSQELDMASCELDTYLSNLRAEIDNVLADDEHVAMFNKGGEGNVERLHSSCSFPSSFAGYNASESTREGNLCVDGRGENEEPHLACGTSGICLRNQWSVPQPNLWINKCNLKASKIPKPPLKGDKKQTARKKKGISVPKLLTQCKSACAAWRSPERPKISLIPLQPRKSAEVGVQSNLGSSVLRAEIHSLKEMQLEHNRSSSHFSKPCDPDFSDSPEVTQPTEEFLMSGAHMNPIYAGVSDEEMFTRGDLESYLHSGSGQPIPVGRCIRSVVERLLDVDGLDDKTPGTWLYEAKDASNDPEKIVGPSSNVPWIRDFATISEVVGSTDEADLHPVSTAGDQDFQAAGAVVSDFSSKFWDCEVGASAADLQSLGTERDHLYRSDVGSLQVVGSTGIVQASLGSWASSSNISSSSFSSPLGALQQNTLANDLIECEDSTLDAVLARACNQNNLLPLDYESVFIEDLLEPCWSEDQDAQSEFERSFEKENDFFAMEDTLGSSVLEWSFSSPRSDAAHHENKGVTHTEDDIAASLKCEDIDADWLEDDPQPSGFQISGEEFVSKTGDSGFRPLLHECLWSADVSFSEKQGKIEKQEGEYNSELVDSLSAYVDACALSLPEVMFDNPGPDTDESGVNLAIGSYFPNMLWSSENSEDEEQLCDEFGPVERPIGICTSLGFIDEFTFTTNIEHQHEKASQILMKSVAEHVKGGALSWLPNSTGTIPGCPGHESVSTYSLSVRDWIMSTCSLKTNKDIRSIQTLSSCASSLPCFTEVHIVDGCKFTGHNPLWIPRTDYEHEETQESKLACEGQLVFRQWEVSEVSEVSDDEEDPPLAGSSSCCSDTSDRTLPQWAGAVGREKEDLCGNKIWYSPPKMGIASKLASSFRHRKSRSIQRSSRSASVGCISFAFGRSRRQKSEWDRVWERHHFGP